VSLQNLLVAPPRSRNPLLADIVKRIGLAERTGRGIDRIYEGMLRYGRPVPDYSMSDIYSVVLFMSRADADISFLEMILAYEARTGVPMPIDSLIILPVYVRNGVSRRPIWPQAPRSRKHRPARPSKSWWKPG